ncbi:MAG: sporulation protein YunB [Clostridia bacterium]|nr:sporulation protein YunB [Clostridia bacterium]
MRHKKKLRLVALGLAALVLCAFLFININLRPVLVGLASARVQAIAAQAMNDAILEVIGDGTRYAELVTIHANDEKVYLLQANSSKLNVLAADCGNAALARITALGEQGVKIPLGTITGVPIFSGVGPQITMKFTPAGAVKGSFESEFTSAGINQTMHRIHLKLTATLRVILPGESHTLTVDAAAPIAENIIVGEVPNAYTNVANEEDLLNLIPEG